MENKKFSGADLEEALKSDSLAKPGLVLTGMVKSSANAGYVAFTRNGCDNWTDLPIGMIEEAEQIGTRPCKDHSHAVFRIVLKEPKDPAAKVLAALLTEPQGPGPGGPSMGGAPYPPAAAFGGRMGGPYEAMQPGAGFSRARIGQGGFGGGFGGGGLNAWGCWDSTCTRCLLYEYVCNGAGFCWNICKIWEEYPCERCIWPW